MSTLGQYLILPLCLLIIALGFMYQARFKRFIPEKYRIPTVYTVFILALMASLIWAAFDPTEHGFLKYFLSYTVATSFYELFLKWVKRQFESRSYGYGRSRYGNDRRDTNGHEIP